MALVGIVYGILVVIVLILPPVMTLFDRTVRRGRATRLAYDVGSFVLWGSLLAALGFTNISGMILADWWNASIGTLLPIDQAAEVFAMVKSSPLLPIWNGTDLDQTTDETDARPGI